MTQEELNLIKEKIFIPLNSRREVWVNALETLTDPTLLKHYEWCLTDLDNLEQYYKEEFDFLEKRFVC